MCLAGWKQLDVQSASGIRPTGAPGNFPEPILMKRNVKAWLGKAPKTLIPVKSWLQVRVKRTLHRGAHFLSNITLAFFHPG